MRGKAGAAGHRGSPGPAMKPSEVLAVVDDQFRQIRKGLDLQLQRTAQIQAQLDHLDALVKQLVGVGEST